MLKEAADAARIWGGVTEWPDRAEQEGFVAALLGGGDGRLAIDPGSGTSKYLCPPVPAPHLVCASSCTASPVSVSGFAAAEVVWREISGAETQHLAAQRLAAQAETVRARLLGHFGVASLAEAILCPSGTDALQVATGLLAAERPHVPITAILPNAAETGSGVPAAVAAAHETATVEIALRDETGAPLAPATLNAAFAGAAAAAQGAGRRPLIFLTYGTKTGLIAPAEPPQGADVIVDACQARILPARVVAFLRRGWPVVVTGSKFFGGPAFSGAVLFPRDRGAAVGRPPAACAPGVVLRWVAALDGMQRFARAGTAVQEALAGQGRAIRRGIAGIPSLVKVAGLPEDNGAWDERASIFTFAVRDPADGRRLTAAALRPLYQRLARAGVLLGQPVALGAFGGLRIAVGARDVSGAASDDLPRLFDTLAEATAPAPAGGR